MVRVKASSMVAACGFPPTDWITSLSSAPVMVIFFACLDRS